MDRNGNKIIRVTYPNGRAFSIQTNVNLPKIHSMRLSDKDLPNISKSELKEIEDELIKYIERFGSENQMKRLRIYNHNG